MCDKKNPFNRVFSMISTKLRQKMAVVSICIFFACQLEQKRIGFFEFVYFINVTDITTVRGICYGNLCKWTKIVSGMSSLRRNFVLMLWLPKRCYFSFFAICVWESFVLFHTSNKFPLGNIVAQTECNLVLGQCFSFNIFFRLFISLIFHSFQHLPKNAHVDTVE